MIFYFGFIFFLPNWILYFTAILSEGICGVSCDESYLSHTIAGNQARYSKRPSWHNYTKPHLQSLLHTKFNKIIRSNEYLGAITEPQGFKRIWVLFHQQLSNSLPPLWRLCFYHFLRQWWHCMLFRHKKFMYKRCSSFTNPLVLQPLRRSSHGESPSFPLAWLGYQFRSFLSLSKFS